MRYHSDQRDVDREQIPNACPECGTSLRVEEFTGSFYVHGPADRQLARDRHSVEAQDGDWVDWVGLNARCPTNDWSLYHLVA